MKRKTIQSPHIASIGYDEANATLEVEFSNESVYRYWDVPNTVYREFLASSAPGRFFQENIKSGGFTYQRVSSASNDSSAESPTSGERAFVLWAVLVVVVAAGLVFGILWAIRRFGASAEVVYTTGVFGGFALLGWVLLRYLGEETLVVTSAVLKTFSLLGTTGGGISRRLGEQIYERELRRREAALAATLDELRITLATGGAGVQLNDEEKAKIVTAITDQISGHGVMEMLGAVEAKYGTAIAKSSYLIDLRLQFDRTKDRLLTEIGALSRRSNLNLVIGVLTTVGAVGLLGYIVLNTQLVVADWRAVLPSYLLRLSLVVFIEVFAFFFLRMYRSNLQDVKYFQNELTNVESRFIALESSIVQGDISTASDMIRTLGNVERNMVLNHGQSTVELERLKSENQTLKTVLESLAGLARKQ